MFALRAQGLTVVTKPKASGASPPSTPMRSTTAPARSSAPPTSAQDGESLVAVLTPFETALQMLSAGKAGDQRAALHTLSRELTALIRQQRAAVEAQLYAALYDRAEALAQPVDAADSAYQATLEDVRALVAEFKATVEQTRNTDDEPADPTLKSGPPSGLTSSAEPSASPSIRRKMYASVRTTPASQATTTPPTAPPGRSTRSSPRIISSTASWTTSRGRFRRTDFRTLPSAWA